MRQFREPRGRLARRLQLGEQRFRSLFADHDQQLRGAVADSKFRFVATVLFGTHEGRVADFLFNRGLRTFFRSQRQQFLQRVNRFRPILFAINDDRHFDFRVLGRLETLHINRPGMRQRQLRELRSDLRCDRGLLVTLRRSGAVDHLGDFFHQLSAEVLHGLLGEEFLGAIGALRI